jgi:hypothetical protein
MTTTHTPDTSPDSHGNRIAQEGCDRCDCGCKYWENDCCTDCGTHISQVTPQAVQERDRIRYANLTRLATEHIAAEWGASFELLGARIQQALRAEAILRIADLQDDDEVTPAAVRRIVKNGYAWAQCGF